MLVLLAFWLFCFACCGVLGLLASEEGDAFLHAVGDCASRLVILFCCVYSCAILFVVFGLFPDLSFSPLPDGFPVSRLCAYGAVLAGVTQLFLGASPRLLGAHNGFSAVLWPSLALPMFPIPMGCGGGCLWGGVRSCQGPRLWFWCLLELLHVTLGASLL